MKCLIVDDSRVVRKVTERIVQNLGFECFEAGNGQEAYDFCIENTPDVVLLDWNMPVMSGIEFLEKIKAHDNGKNIKVIFCTTENSPDYIERAMNAGADEYIMKPFDREIIKSKLALVGLISA